jgi:diamine N-acetyltransferase
MITIDKAGLEDYKIIQEIAYKTWPHTYGEILSENQLDYMLDAFYSESVLKENIKEKGHQFLLAKEKDTVLGFASFEHNYLQKNKTRIHKIYILPENQGKGIGKLLIDAIEKFANENHSSALSLNVNRFNKALTFYKKMGFEIIAHEDIEIGHGFLMEDYIMEKPL